MRKFSPFALRANSFGKCANFKSPCIVYKCYKCEFKKNHPVVKNKQEKKYQKIVFFGTWFSHNTFRTGRKFSSWFFIKSVVAHIQGVKYGLHKSMASFLGLRILFLHFSTIKMIVWKYSWHQKWRTLKYVSFMWDILYKYFSLTIYEIDMTDQSKHQT